MKKSLASIFFSLSSITGAVNAQSDIQIYGSIDAGITLEQGGPAGSVTKLATGVPGGNRLGFRGSENLGDGLTAFFVLENGFAADTGNLGQGGLMFGRRAYVGLKGDFGSITFGRQYGPHFYALGFVADPFESGLAGAAQNVMDPDTIRVNNAAIYATPSFKGVSADVMYAPGEIAGNNKLGRTLGGSLKYMEGATNVILAFHDRYGMTPAIATTKSTLLVGTHNFAWATLHAAIGQNRGPAAQGSTNNREILLGATIVRGANKLLLSYIRKDDRNAANIDVNQFAIGYIYSLSKRTSLYAAYATITNDTSLAYRVGNASDLGTGNKAMNVGIRHVF
ncbi:MAG: porin [Pseudomonadota bacterium]